MSNHVYSMTMMIISNSINFKFLKLTLTSQYFSSADAFRFLLVLPFAVFALPWTFIAFTLH